MAITHIHAPAWSRGNESRSGRREITFDLEKNFEVTVPAGTTDMEVDIDIDVSNLKSLFMKATTEDVTLETNDGTTPAETLTLKADQGESWHDQLNTDNPLGSTDVTSVFLTNAGTTDSVVSFFAGVEATP